MKNVKIQNSETILSLFTRVSKIKERFEVVEENVEEGEEGEIPSQQEEGQETEEYQKR